MPYKDKSKSREYHREYNRTYMRESRKKNIEKFKARDTRWRTNNPLKRLIFSTRQTSKRRGLEHTITELDLLLPELCPYTGIKIDYSAGKGKTMSNPSIDRVNPLRGYVAGNVEVVSSLGNTMKNNASIKILQHFAKEILKRWPIDGK